MSNKLTKEDVERLRFQAEMEQKGWKLNHDKDVWIKRTRGETHVVSDWQAKKDWRAGRRPGSG